MSSVPRNYFKPGTRCDRCSALGLIGFYSSDLRLGLTLCGHHARTHGQSLTDKGFTDRVELSPDSPRLDFTPTSTAGEDDLDLQTTQ